MKAVARVLHVSRSNIAEQLKKPVPGTKGRPPGPDTELVAAIRSVIADMPTYGYRRVHAILKRQAHKNGTAMPNHKRVYRVMKANNLLLQRHAAGDSRCHNGRIATDMSNMRWCSDGLELTCDNAEKVRIAFALDCCDREVMSYVATTSGIKGEDVCDLMLAAVEHRFGQVNRLPTLIEWLTDNGSCYIAGETKNFARHVGLEPRTTPVRSPQSNGMAEAFVRTLKRDYARVSPLPDAATVIAQLPQWFAHYNTVHPHKALGYRSPREFINSRSTGENMSGF
jgi:putative transposase